MKFLFEVNPDKPLHNNYSFWFAIVTPILIALILSVPLAISSGAPCLTHDCQKRFIELFQLPIGISSISILLGVMVGRFHGSAQRVMSYQQAQENNTFRNFYDHRKYFIDWLCNLHVSKIEELEYIKLESSTRLYERLFCKNSPAHVSTQITSGLVESAYDDIVANMHTFINSLHTAHIVKESEPNYVISPEWSASLLRQTIRDCNKVLQPFGIALRPIEEWPNQKYKHDFMRVFLELSSVLTLAGEFSASYNTLRLSIPHFAAEQAKSDFAQGYISLAISFGVDREAKN